LKIPKLRPGAIPKLMVNENINEVFHNAEVVDTLPKKRKVN